MATDPQDAKKGAARAQRRLWSSPSTLGAAAVTGVGVLTSVFLAANRNLTGFHFLAAILFAAAAVLLMVEAFNRAQAGVGWISVGGIGVLLAAASLTFVALPAKHHSGAARGPIQPADGSSAPVSGGGLALSLRPIEPEFFHLAFYKQIPLPKPNEGWSQLRRRGGIDAGDTNFRMILANRSTEPISVLSVRVEVLGSKPRPHGTFTYRFSQGEEGLGKLTAAIDQVHPHAIARVYKSSAAVLDPVERKKIIPYFQTTYILLRPGEVYPAALSIHAESGRLVRFRLIAEGHSAGHTFVRRSPIHSLIGRSGAPSDERYARTYAVGQFPGLCTTTPESPWYDARYLYSNSGKPCPSGANAPEEVSLKEPAKYPPGRFRLDLGLQPGAQKATVDDVTVGRPPAAQPVASVALPLIRALGAWSLCVDRWPVPGYWTASWERWGLSMVFAGEGSADCMPQSASRVREIELWGPKQTIHTDDGLVTVGTEPARIPAAIRADATVEGNPNESAVLLRGVSSCDPGRLVDRAQITPGFSAGGILALHIKRRQWTNRRGREVRSSEIDRAVTTLPEREC
ncbi:MAG TPA: hypothetical protein VNS60_04270 [Solirubrobacterales bacterium]|nr:hypothetical protein [Solirubrobacterales bacterium]